MNSKSEALLCYRKYLEMYIVAKQYPENIPSFEISTSNSSVLAGMLGCPGTSVPYSLIFVYLQCAV